MSKENTNENEDKPMMVNVGVRVSQDIRVQLEAIAKKERRKLGEFVRIKLEDIVEEYTKAA